MAIGEKFSNNRKKDIKHMFGDEAENEVGKMEDPTIRFEVFIEEDGEVALYVEGDITGADVDILSKALKTLFKAFGVNCTQKYCKSILRMAEEK